MTLGLDCSEVAANKYPNTTHLKQGRAYPDPIATAKTNSHFTDSAKHVEIHKTPDAKSGASDSHDSRGWAPINPCADTYTTDKGSKRD